jgi:hypothetical protein
MRVSALLTRYGDLTQAEISSVEAIRIQAMKAIHQCKDHRRERCSCWRSAREALFELRCQTGEGTAISMAALAVWNTIEAVARDRPQQSSNKDQGGGRLTPVSEAWVSVRSPQSKQCSPQS